MAIGVAACGGGALANQPGESDNLHPDISRRESARPAPSATTQSACDEYYASLLRSSGSALVERIRFGDQPCIDDLEWQGSNAPLQIHVSREDNVIAVATAVADLVDTYDGSKRQGLKQLFSYLNVAKDIHDWCRTRRRCRGDEWQSVPRYPVEPGSAAFIATTDAFAAFIDHPLFMADDETHADNVWQFLRAVYEWRVQYLYLDMVSRWIDGWTPHRASVQIFQDVMYQMLRLLYHRSSSAFGPAYGQHDALLRSMRNFVLDRRWLGTESQWVAHRLTIELARFTKYKGTPNYTAVASVVREVIAAYRNEEAGKGIWLRMVAELDYNDAANCDRYMTCDWYAGSGFNANFRKALFSDVRTCALAMCPADRVTIHAQQLTPAQLVRACQRLDTTAMVFHQLFETDCAPVPGDLNAQLDIYVFNDGDSCEHLESAAFGRHPDSCSGIYWEGDPGDGRAARFVATEYTPDERPPDPHLSIWNFEHEYVHYLDGRYNRRGPYRGHDPSIHWWTEGLAEYIASEVSPHIRVPAYSSPHSLTKTLLESGSIPTRYRHRHLAVRYLLQNERAFVDPLLDYMRSGAYADYTDFMRNNAPDHEQGWRAWLDVGGNARVLRLTILSRPRADVYGIGERLRLAVDFSHQPMITSGDPVLQLNLGDRLRSARLSSTSYSTWHFTYRVRASDRDDDGFAIDRNGLTWDGTVTGPGGFAAVPGLAHNSQADVGGHEVDGSTGAFPDVTGDFDGDRRADIMLWDHGGRSQQNLMDGARVAQVRHVAPLEIEYRFQALGDFDGDGRDQVLVRTLDGRWLYFSGEPSGNTEPTELTGITSDRAWLLAGVGDLDGDGIDDLVLRHVDGRWRYHSNRPGGRAATGRVVVLRELDGWQLVAVGDFDGDDKEDLLLRHENGLWRYRPMDGHRVLTGGGNVRMTSNTQWRFRAVGDFNGDGKDDILLRHAEGAWAYYAMDGRFPLHPQTGWARLTRNLDYGFAGAGDFDGDGRADVLLRHAEGRWLLHAMQGRLPLWTRIAGLTTDSTWAPLP